MNEVVPELTGSQGKLIEKTVNDQRQRRHSLPTILNFDEEGFYGTGDAPKFVNPNDPNAGMVFDGRIAEDFKLNTGTWVSVGVVRTQLTEAGRGPFTDALQNTLTLLAKTNTGSATLIKKVVFAHFTPSIDAGVLVTNSMVKIAKDIFAD